MGKFEDAFKQVCELAEDFRRNENQYLSPSYINFQLSFSHILNTVFRAKFPVSGSLIFRSNCTLIGF